MNCYLHRMIAILLQSARVCKGLAAVIVVSIGATLSPSLGANGGGVSSNPLHTRALDQLTLGEGRLFIHANQRAALDSQNGIEADSKESFESVMSVPPAEGKSRTTVIRQVRKADSVRLDGVVVRPFGEVDVWVNGSRVSGKTDSRVKVLSATSIGPVVLGIGNRVFSLHPGQVIRYAATGTRAIAEDSL